MSLSKSKIFLICLLAVNLGLGFGFKFSLQHMALTAMCCIVLFTLGGRRVVVLSGLAGLVLAGSAYWSKLKEPADYSKYFNQKIRYTVIVLTDPETKEKSQTFLGKVVALEGRNGDKTRSRIAVVMPKYPALEYGMRLELEGEFEQVNEFNYKDNVSAQTIFPKILEMEIGHGNPVRKKLYDLKRFLLANMNKMISAPESGLLGGILLGTRHMPEQLLEEFRVTGTSHIIAVSGFNVTIVATFLDGMFRRFGRTASFYSSVVAIAGFVIVTGASASVVRAGIMGSLGLVSQYFGRLYSSVNALLLTSAIMLLQNPKLLMFDIGFQLSFAALMGLMFVQPIFEAKWPGANILVSSIFPTIAAQITTSPMILYHFGNFSVIAVVANLFVLPGIPVAMLVGFVSLLVFMFVPAAGIVLGSTVWLLLHAIIWIIGKCADVPLADINNIPFPLYAAVAYYILLFWFIRTWKTKQNTFSNS